APWAVSWWVVLKAVNGCELEEVGCSRSSLKELGILPRIPDAKALYTDRFVPARFAARSGHRPRWQADAATRSRLLDLIHGGPMGGFDEPYQGQAALRARHPGPALHRPPLWRCR